MADSDEFKELLRHRDIKLEQKRECDVAFGHLHSWIVATLAPVILFLRATRRVHPTETDYDILEIKSEEAFERYMYRAERQISNLMGICDDAAEFLDEQQQYDESEFIRALTETIFTWRNSCLEEDDFLNNNVFRRFISLEMEQQADEVYENHDAHMQIFERDAAVIIGEQYLVKDVMLIVCGYI